MSATTFGPYELRGLLGRGGMGEVHRAFDRDQSRVVALKLLPPDLRADEEFVERFDARKHDSWTFVSLPADGSGEIRDLVGGHAGGFGSVRVAVTIGSTTWQTSIFRDAAKQVYVLPVKKAVRAAEGLATGDSVRVMVELRDF